MSSPPSLDLSVLLAAPLALPCLPRTVALLLNELAPQAPSLRRLTQLFSTDPVLATRLLALANAPAYQMAHKVASVPEALVLLSLAPLRQLVQAAPLGMGRRAVPGMDLACFVRCSLDTAKVARALASLVQVPASMAYTAGLIHAVGELVMHLQDAEHSRALSDIVDPLDPRRADLEWRLTGYTYSHVTAALASRWHFPSLLVEALHHMHAPLDNPAFEPLAGVLHLAAWRARSRQALWSDRELAVSFPGEVGVALGLDIDMVLRQDPIDWNAGAELDVML